MAAIVDLPNRRQVAQLMDVLVGGAPLDAKVSRGDAVTIVNSSNDYNRVLFAIRR